MKQCRAIRKADTKRIPLCFLRYFSYLLSVTTLSRAGAHTP